MVELQIKFRSSETAIAILEFLEVAPLGGTLFRLEHSPVFCESAHYGDVIELNSEEEGTWKFVRVVEPSPWLHTNRILSGSLVESERFQLWLESILERGGFWEVALGGIVFISWPPESQIDVEAEMSEVIKPYSV